MDNFPGINDVPGELKAMFKSDAPGMFKFRQMVIFVLSQSSFLLALLSFYLTDILAHFIYAILYVVSPLAFLCLVPKATMHVPKNLFKGIVTVMVWKVLWSILGMIIFAFVTNPVHDWENFFVTVTINVAIGLSMLAIPLFTRSLINDGLEGMASSVMGATTIPLARGIARTILRQARRMPGSVGNMANSHVYRPIKNRFEKSKWKDEKVEMTPLQKKRCGGVGMNWDKLKKQVDRPKDGAPGKKIRREDQRAEQIKSVTTTGKAGQKGGKEIMSKTKQ